MNIRIGSEGQSPSLTPGSNPGFVFKELQKEERENGTSYKLVFSRPGNKDFWAWPPKVFTRTKSTNALRPVFAVQDSINDALNYVLNLTSQFCGIAEMEQTIKEMWLETNKVFKTCLSGTSFPVVITDEEVWEKAVQDFYDDLMKTMELCLEGHTDVEGNLLLHYNNNGYLEIPTYCKDTCYQWGEGKKGGTFPLWESSQSIFLTTPGDVHVLEGTRLQTVSTKQIGFPEPQQEVSVPAEPDAW